MVTENVDADVEILAAEGGRAIAAASSTAELAQVETEVLGKRSPLTRAHRRLGALDPEERKEAGRRLNEVRARLQVDIETRRASLEQTVGVAALAADRLDLTEVIPEQVLSSPARGHLHLVTQARGRARGCFRGHGFHRGGGTRGRIGLVQLRGTEHPSRSSGPWHVRHHLPRPGRARDRVVAHAHVAGADPSDGARGGGWLVADPRRHAGQVLPTRHSRRSAPARVQPDLEDSSSTACISPSATSPGPSRSSPRRTSAPDAVSPSAGLLPLHRAVSRVGDHVHPLPGRGVEPARTPAG